MTSTTQAERIYAKFGGASKLHAAIVLLRPMGKPLVSRTTVYRWNMPAPQGSAGNIPTKRHGLIMAAARIEGVILTPEDWYGYEIAATPDHD